MLFDNFKLQDTKLVFESSETTKTFTDSFFSFLLKNPNLGIYFAVIMISDNQMEYFGKHYVKSNRNRNEADPKSVWKKFLKAFQQGNIPQIDGVAEFLGIFHRIC